MCNGYEMIVRNAGITDKTFKGTLAIERDLKKFEYYSTRYMEHGKSTQFARNQLNKIKDEIEEVSAKTSLLSPNDLAFLIEVGELSVAARKFVALTYVYRFYLRGKNRQYFFDFMQKDLEKSLEVLTAKSELEWLNYL